MVVRTDTTNCATLTEKELSQHCVVVSCEHRNSTRSHDCRLFQSDCRIPKTLSSKKFSTAGSTRDTFTFSVSSPDSCTVHFKRVCQTLSFVPLQLAWLARLANTRRGEAQLLLSHVGSLGSIVCPSIVTERLTLCISIRIVHRVLSWRSLSASSDLVSVPVL